MCNLPCVQRFVTLKRGESPFRGGHPLSILHPPPPPPSEDPWSSAYQGEAPGSPSSHRVLRVVTLLRSSPVVAPPRVSHPSLSPSPSPSPLPPRHHLPPMADLQLATVYGGPPYRCYLPPCIPPRAARISPTDLKAMADRYVPPRLPPPPAPAVLDDP